MDTSQWQGLRRVAIGAGLALLALVPAHATEGSFAVRVRVRSATPPVAAHLDTLPMPAGARRLTRLPAGDSYWFDGSVAAAAAHFARTMPARGYRLVQARDGASTWAGATGRVDIRLQPVLGATPATRILVAP